MTPLAIQEIQQELYISNSQIFTYQNCSLKYQYQYIEQRPVERLSSALIFGKQIHSVLEVYYREVKQHHQAPALPRLLELFKEGLSQSVRNSTVPIIFKKEVPDLDSLIGMGQGLISAFYENVDLTGMEVVDIELALSAQLYDENGEALDIKIFGIIDLLLKDSAGNLIVIDHKTAKQKKSQSAADEDLQMTVYSYLLAANKYVFSKAEVQCRFDILRKLKTPKFETVLTKRGPEQRRQFSKLATAVLQGIESRVFIPCKSWMCGDCQFADTCREEW